MANFLEREHFKINELIKGHLDEISLFGKVILSKDTLDTKGGKQEINVYKLNREQAMFLITLMDNTEKVLKFKVALIKRFSIMERELLRRNETRTLGITIRKDFTETLDLLIETDDPLKKRFSFSNYSNLIYKKVLNKTAKEYRIDNNLKEKENIRNFMSIDELTKINQCEDEIKCYIRKNKLYKLSAKESYEKVKVFLLTI